MPFHADYTGVDIHVPITFTYANATARTTATGFVSGDLYKFAVQTDDDSIWMLVATTPTWSAVGGSGGIPPALANASFWTRTAESSLSNESDMGALTTGLVKNTVSAGVGTPSTATGGSDYAYPPDGTTLDTTGSTTEIKNAGVTNAKLANMAAKTLKGNATSGSAAPTDLTAPVVSGEMTASDFVASGLTGAIAASRYVGATASGAPVSGTFAAGDFIVDQTGKLWVCTGGGTPGTWAGTGAGSGSVTSVATGTGLTGGTITTTGTISFASVADKTVLGNISGGSAASSAQTDPVVSGTMTGTAHIASGLTGATAASRYVGATTTGAPSSGTFVVGDFVVDQKGQFWVCISAGTPGTWFPVGPTLLENHQTATSYPVVLADVGYIINCDNGSPFTLTFPANGTIAIPVGTQIDIWQGGAGQITVAVTSDTLHAPNGTKSAKQYSRMTMWKQAATVWVLSGDTTT